MPQRWMAPTHDREVDNTMIGDFCQKYADQ
jgi:hypothetical protein